jgi:23S rRNA (uracil1939-C5)-methyltransferase
VGKLDDGRVVFVPRTAAGDLVELARVGTHNRFARARAARVIEAGPGRTRPRCMHYVAEECGGCQLQHLDYESQLGAKREIVADALARIGKLDITVPPVIAADDQWAYRSRITLALAPGRRHAGFHPLDQPGRVFPLERCEIAAPVLMQLWQALRPGLHLLPSDADHLVLRVDREGGLHAVVRASGMQAWTGAKRLADGTLARGTAVTIWWQPERGAPRVVAGDRGTFPATVFEQVHPELADRIRGDAVASLGDVRNAHIWDLYAGIGETTDRLHGLGATVESVELDGRAVEAAESHWRETVHERPESQRPEPAGIVRHVGRVEELLRRLRDPSAVIANPPRNGMEAVVTEELRRRRPGRIVYVSCDPATLARDLGRLCGTGTRGVPGPTVDGSYRLTRVQPYDLFPQTAHVETVAVLER